MTPRPIDYARPEPRYRWQCVRAVIVAACVVAFVFLVLMVRSLILSRP